MSSSIFTGNSRFSTDFSQIIDRTVAIASLPLKQLQQQKATIDTRTAALTSMKTKVASLQSSVQALAGAFGTSSFVAVSGNETAATVTAGPGASAGSWDIKVTDRGSATSFVVTGFPPVADPRSGVYTSSATQTLLVDLDPSDGLNNPEVFTLSPPGSTLQQVVDEINKKAGSRVQATVVNTGSTADPQYQLALQSRDLGPVSLKFVDGANSSENVTSGTLATYTVNGTTVRSNSRTVTLAPDVTLQLKDTSAGAFSISVSRTTSSLQTALENFVTAYNGVASELGKHRGTNAALAGDSLIGTTQGVLRKLLTIASPSDSFSTLTDIGLGINASKQLYLDKAIFDKATSGKIDTLQSFIGTTDTGIVKRANDLLDTLTKTTSGIISSALETNEAASKAQSLHISQQQERIDRLQDSLNARMAEADSRIAMLEQQVTYFKGMWTAMSGNQER